MTYQTGYYSVDNSSASSTSVEKSEIGHMSFLFPNLICRKLLRQTWIRPASFTMFYVDTCRQESIKDKMDHHCDSPKQIPTTHDLVNMIQNWHNEI